MLVGKSFKILETDIGIGAEVFADLVKVSGQHKQGMSDIDQPADHRCGAFHRVLDIGAFEQFINQHQPLSAIVDTHYGILDALHFIVKKALALDQIIRDVNIGQDPIEQT